jgi:hypothetical protein
MAIDFPASECATLWTWQSHKTYSTHHHGHVHPTEPDPQYARKPGGSITDQQPQPVRTDVRVVHPEPAGSAPERLNRQGQLAF